MVLIKSPERWRKKDLMTGTTSVEISGKAVERYSSFGLSAEINVAPTPLAGLETTVPSTIIVKGLSFGNCEDWSNL